MSTDPKDRPESADELTDEQIEKVSGGADTGTDPRQKGPSKSYSGPDPDNS